MAKVRAYKIAAELDIEKDEFVRRAAEVGIELRSAMVALDEEQADELRRKLGGPGAAGLVEKRVAGGVIRRRKKAPPPEPVPEPETPAAPAGAEPLAAQPLAAAEEQPLAAAEEPAAPAAEEPAELPEPPAPPAVPELPEPEPTVVQPAAVATAEPVAAQRPGVPAPPSSGRELAEPARPVRRPVRRQAVETANLREQETLARQMRGNVQAQLERRRVLVEQQSRIQSRRKRPVGGTGRRQLPRERRHKLLKLSGPLSFAELSGELGTKVSELVRRARGLGVDLDRDALVDVETAELLAAELGFEVQHTTTDIEKELVEAEPAEESEPRAPVVTVMGHVDHGKTSLLDTIRQANVVAGEAGGITQHIGAYRVAADGGTITFLDTPGHAAFTQMRARGAQITDIAVLVVAANDGVMPQTVEAIAHARAARVPVIVAVNKIDLPEANPSRVKQGLLEHELVPEELGGDTICVEVSATKGTGVDKLLEMINLQAEVLELKARAKGRARGTVVEAELERGRGPVATVLVQAGTLRRGDAAVVGQTYGRIRALTDERGRALKQAGPSTPVQVTGLESVPDAGDELVVVKNEREAKTIAEHRVEETRRAAGGEVSHEMDAAALFAQLDESEQKQLLVVLKADVRGTMEATRDALQGLSTERVELDVIHSGVGAITERDVMLASASKALVVGFHVRPESAARKAAEAEGVEIRTSDVVYELIDDIRATMAGLLPPKTRERVTGHAEVRELFPIPRVGTIAGCVVADGQIRRADLVRVVRDGVPVYTGRLDSLRRHKDDAREVQSGVECGIHVENFNDVKVGDVLEVYSIEESPDTL